MTSTQSGGRLITGDTPWGEYRVEFDRNGQVISGHCKLRPHGRNGPNREQQSRGLGDTVAKMTGKMGVKKPCGGCGRRRDKLNKMFPYHAK